MLLRVNQIVKNYATVLLALLVIVFSSLAVGIEVYTKPETLKIIFPEDNFFTSSNLKYSTNQKIEIDNNFSNIGFDFKEEKESTSNYNEVNCLPGQKFIAGECKIINILIYNEYTEKRKVNTGVDNFNEIDIEQEILEIIKPNTLEFKTDKIYQEKVNLKLEEAEPLNKYNTNLISNWNKKINNSEFNKVITNSYNSNAGSIIDRNFICY